MSKRLEELLSTLNEKQREAVEFFGKPLLVLAGAGSGKTRVITYKIAYMIEKGLYKDLDILAVTFTNKAAEEMKRRVCELLGKNHNVWIGTFHSFGAFVLRREAHHFGRNKNFTILDNDDTIKIVKNIFVQNGISTFSHSPENVADIILKMKIKFFMSGNKNYPLKTYDQDKRIAKSVHEYYENYLIKSNSFDFEDLLICPVKLWTENTDILEKYKNRYKYILVDEFQDTNSAQYQMIYLLTSKSHNICVVGDDDQSIYGWRGANVEHILNFKEDYPDTHIVRLEENYRSSQNILNFATNVISQNTNRHRKNLWSKINSNIKPIIVCCYDEDDEAWAIAKSIINLKNQNNNLKDIAVLYRTHAQSRIIEEELLQNSIPYKVVGGLKFFERKEIKDIIAYLNLFANPYNDYFIERVINLPPRGIGKTKINLLKKLAIERNITIWEILENPAFLPPELQNNEGINEFVNIIINGRQLSISEPVSYITEWLLDEIELKEYLSNKKDEKEKGRIQNINELLVYINKMEEEQEIDLTEFIQKISLFTTIDTFDENIDSVTLMTLHNAKGLEFKSVLIPGIDDGMIPHITSVREGYEEEERRLFYVGITRAKENLLLFFPSKRSFYSRYFVDETTEIEERDITRFLTNIPYTSFDIISTRELLFLNSFENLENNKKNLKNFNIFKNIEKKSEYLEGMKVHHNSFGVGIIKKVIGRGNNTRLLIHFLIH